MCARAVPTFALALILHPENAAAQSVDLPSVQVTATHITAAHSAPQPAGTPADQSGDVVTSPTTVQTPVTEIANSITVITAADIASKQRRTLPDALQDAPGLNIVQTGGPGGQTSIFM